LSAETDGALIEKVRNMDTQQLQMNATEAGNPHSKVADCSATRLQKLSVPSFSFATVCYEFLSLVAKGLLAIAAYPIRILSEIGTWRRGWLFLLSYILFLGFGPHSVVVPFDGAGVLQAWMLNE
jgi:hypothetical protein